MDSLVWNDWAADVDFDKAIVDDVGYIAYDDLLAWQNDSCCYNFDNSSAVQAIG